MSANEIWQFVVSVVFGGSDSAAIGCTFMAGIVLLLGIGYSLAIINRPARNEQHRMGKYLTFKQGGTFNRFVGSPSDWQDEYESLKAIETRARINRIH